MLDVVGLVDSDAVALARRLRENAGLPPSLETPAVLTVIAMLLARTLKAEA
jgi:hypothetical protein